MYKPFFNNQALIIITIFLFGGTLFSGCYSLVQTEAIDDPSIKIYEIETLENKTISFKKYKFGYAAVLEDNLVCIKSNGEELVFPKTNIKKKSTLINLIVTLLLY